MMQENSIGSESQMPELPVRSVRNQTGAWLAQTIRMIHLRQYVVVLVVDQYENCQDAAIFMWLIQNDRKNKFITERFMELFRAAVRSVESQFSSFLTNR